MMQYLVELYSAKPAWLTLGAAGRRQFFEAIGTGIGQLSALGVEALSFGETDPTTIHASSARFFAIWRAPDATAIRALVDGIAASGWHDYFETVNAVGTGVGIDDHLAQLATP